MSSDSKRHFIPSMNILIPVTKSGTKPTTGAPLQHSRLLWSRVLGDGTGIVRGGEHRRRRRSERGRSRGQPAKSNLTKEAATARWPPSPPPPPPPPLPATVKISDKSHQPRQWFSGTVTLSETGFTCGTKKQVFKWGHRRWPGLTDWVAEWRCRSNTQSMVRSRVESSAARTKRIQKVTWSLKVESFVIIIPNGLGAAVDVRTKK